MSKPGEKTQSGDWAARVQPLASKEAVTSRSLWFSGPRTIEMREKTVRPPEPGEVRIRALCSSISHGTEMLIYRGEVAADLPLDLTLPSMEGSFAFPIKYGYANVGRIIQPGSRVEGFVEGDLVFAFNPHETDCTIPARFVVKMPDKITPRKGIFLANVETAINVLLDAAPRIGERVVVLGQGTVGLLITQLCRIAGAGLIATCDPFEKRRKLSSALGADIVIDPEAESTSARIREATDGEGADVVIESSGRPEALDEAIRATAREGRVVVVSWYGAKRATLALGEDFHRNRITIKSSQVSNLDPCLAPRWTLERRQELALRYLNELRLEELITHTFSFEDAAAAYRLIDERPEETVQVLLGYD